MIEATEIVDHHPTLKVETGDQSTTATTNEIVTETEIESTRIEGRKITGGRLKAPRGLMTHTIVSIKTPNITAKTATEEAEVVIKINMEEETAREAQIDIIKEIEALIQDMISIGEMINMNLKIVTIIAHQEFPEKLKIQKNSTRNQRLKSKRSKRRKLRS